MTTATKKAHTTREAWLQAAVPTLMAWIEQAGAPAFNRPLVSVGFPYGKRGAGNQKAIGQCWSVPTQERAHIFVHPCLDEPVRVLDVVVHELIHAALPAAAHGPAFVAVAHAVGLEGKPTATFAGPDLEARLIDLVAKLGAYPHVQLDPKDIEKARKKQGTRMLKYTCPCCGQIIRAAKADLQVLCGPCSAEQVRAVIFEAAG